MGCKCPSCPKKDGPATDELLDSSRRSQTQRFARSIPALCRLYLARMPTSTIPQTQNREWGFFGTICHHPDPERAWDIALAFIAGTTGCNPEATRAFLDSRHGRHFADEVTNELAAGKGARRCDQRHYDDLDGLADQRSHRPRDRHPPRASHPHRLRPAGGDRGRHHRVTRHPPLRPDRARPGGA